MLLHCRWGGRVLDFGLVSADIASKVQCDANYKVPFKVHFVGVDFTIDLGFAADTGQQRLHLQIYKFAKAPGFQNTLGQGSFMRRWVTNCDWTFLVEKTLTQSLLPFLQGSVTQVNDILWRLILGQKKG